ncbi:hypothetical protein [Microcoleus anatoxicus]
MFGVDRVRLFQALRPQFPHLVITGCGHFGMVEAMLGMWLR